MFKGLEVGIMLAYYRLYKKARVVGFSDQAQNENRKVVRQGIISLNSPKSRA